MAEKEYRAVWDARQGFIDILTDYLRQIGTAHVQLIDDPQFIKHYAHLLTGFGLFISPYSIKCDEYIAELTKIRKNIIQKNFEFNTTLSKLEDIEKGMIKASRNILLPANEDTADEEEWIEIQERAKQMEEELKQLEKD